MAIPVLSAEIAFFLAYVSMTEQKFDYLDICSKLRGNCLGNEKESDSHDEIISLVPESFLGKI